MICYQDKSFCIQKCANKECDRNFTDGIKSDACKWWGNDNPPIMFSNHKTETCGFLEAGK